MTKPKSGRVVKPEQRSGKKLKWTCYECYSKYVECTHKKPEEVSMKSKRVQKDEKLMNLICNFFGRIDTSLVDAEGFHDAILKRVRAMGRMRRTVFSHGSGLDWAHRQGWNDCNAEWRRRLGGR